MNRKTTLGKTMVVLICFWIIGILLFIWFGLGWFFLVETIRRILFFIPQTFLVIKKTFHIDENVITRDQTQEGNYKASLILRLTTIIFWLCLTILVFLKLNISLISFL